MGLINRNRFEPPSAAMGTFPYPHRTLAEIGANQCPFRRAMAERARTERKDRTTNHGKD